MPAKPLAFSLLVIGIVAALIIGAAAGRADTSYPAGSTGYDISYPQCPSNFPAGGTFGIVGVTNGLPWSANPCLAAEYAWASARSSPPAFYTNTADPGPISSHWDLPGPRQCIDPSSYDDAGCAYNYGWNAAAQALIAASNATSTLAASSHAWWLDVETGNSWNGSAAANSATIQGYLDYLTGQEVPGVGIYSTAFQWGAITGGYALAATPNWIAGSGKLSGAPAYCGASFTGGVVLLVQYRAGGFDGDYACAQQSATATPTRTPTSTPTPTATPTSTLTATRTSTSTPARTVTSTSTLTATSTAQPTNTSVADSATVTPTIDPGLDSDGDGCPDARELGPDWHTGGQRDPMDPWDFYDVPVPVLLPGQTTGTRNSFISIAAAIAVLAYIGTTAAHPATPNANGVTYGSDLNANGIADGQEYDRSQSSDTEQPWRSGPPRGFVSIASAIIALAQVGTNCT